MNQQPEVQQTLKREIQLEFELRDFAEWRAVFAAILLDDEARNPAGLQQAQFGRLRVWDTEDNNGVLIYLCLAERAIELVADRGVDRVVPADQWHGLVQQLATALRAGQYEEGLAQSIDAVCAVLTQHFALQPGQANPNELPDAPVLS